MIMIYRATNINELSGVVSDSMLRSLINPHPFVTPPEAAVHVTDNCLILSNYNSFSRPWSFPFPVWYRGVRWSERYVKQAFVEGLSVIDLQNLTHDTLRRLRERAQQGIRSAWRTPRIEHGLIPLNNPKDTAILTVPVEVGGLKTIPLQFLGHLPPKPSENAVIVWMPALNGSGYLLGVGGTPWLSIALSFPPFAYSGTNSSDEICVFIIATENITFFPTYRMMMFELMGRLNTSLIPDHKTLNLVNDPRFSERLVDYLNRADIDLDIPRAGLRAGEHFDITAELLASRHLKDAVGETNVTYRLGHIGADDDPLDLCTPASMILSKEIACPFVAANSILGALRIVRTQEHRGGVACYSFRLKEMRVNNNTGFNRTRLDRLTSDVQSKFRILSESYIFGTSAFDRIVK